MKKSIVALLFFFLTLGISAQKKKYTVGVLVDYTNEKTEPIKQSLIREIQAVVGEDAEMKFPSAAFYSNQLHYSSKRNLSI